MPGGFGVRRPDRSVRIPPGSFTQDPGMRAQAGQFTDVTSRDYARQAAAQAKRGGALEFGTSVGAERDAGRDRLIMEIVGMVLATMAGAKMGSSPIPDKEMATQLSLAQRKLLPPVHISERIYGGVLGGLSGGGAAALASPTPRGMIYDWDLSNKEDFTGG